MTAPLFWVAPEALAGAVTGGTVTLSGAEAHHAASVQRLRVGETVLVSDAVGLRAQASVTAVRGGASPLVDLRLDGIEQVARRVPELVLVQALAKQRGDEAAVAGATQLGVDRIIPWQAERSIPRWLGAGGAKAAAGRARWVEIVRREGKVARRGRLPVVEDVVDSPGLTARLDRAVNQDGARGIVLLETAAQALASELAEASGASAVWLVVGPEGSITPAELTAFAGAGARTARLGPEVLRTALAGVAALVLAAHQLGRWS